jgi:soluble lytic murein transglycosylase-like protein
MSLKLEEFIKSQYIIQEQIHQTTTMPPAITHKQQESPDVWYAKLGLNSLEKAYGLAPGILKHMIEIESKGNPHAKSQRGAKGLFQIMPAHISGFNGDPFNPLEAAEWAAKTLKSLLDTFGNYSEALAAYNWGRGNVIRKGLKNAPEETKKYISFFQDRGIVKGPQMLKEV